MARPRKIINPKTYAFIMNEEDLFWFKQVANSPEAGPSDVLRWMISIYLEMDNNPNPTEVDRSIKVEGLSSQIDYLLCVNLFDLRAINSTIVDDVVRQLNNHLAAVDKLQKRKTWKLIIDEATGEALTVTTTPESKTTTITSAASQVTITHTATQTTVQMPPDYHSLTNRITKAVVVDSCLTTLEAIASNFSTVFSTKNNVNITQG